MAGGDGRVQPWTANPAYWQYRGEPTLLIGGSVEDNLFQIPNLEEHLDLLVASGGNYIRNTMSSRDPGDVWPFAQVTPGGRYDLRQPNREYWARVERLLSLTSERGIIVQVEIWDRFDCYREPWLDNPFNPVNNQNYSEDGSGLAAEYPMHPGQNKNPFFTTVPEADDNPELLTHQRRFVDWLLAASLRHDHVLYCVDNETSGRPEWGAYWATYVREAAQRSGVEVEVTEMWDSWRLTDPQHGSTFDHPELYSYVEVSQNNHNDGRTHADQLRETRDRLRASGRTRPMNNVKIYGADGGRFGDDAAGEQRFWSDLFGGCATARFHRPPSGLGLGPTAQRHLRSARLLAEAVPIWWGEPRADLLTRPVGDGAYCLARPGGYCAVCLTAGGEVACDASVLGPAEVTVRWLDTARARWSPPRRAAADAGPVTLAAPGAGTWVALVQPAGGDAR